MYQMNEMELWNQRRNELVREAEGGRLARRLKAVRPKKSTVRVWGALLGWALEAPVRLRAEDGGRA